MKATTRAFLIILGMTLLVWILRGLRLLSFLPGFVLWSLILLCLAAAVISAVR